MTEYAITLSGVSRYYKLYARPNDRLKEALHPRKKLFHTKFYVLNNIDLNVRKGEVLGIVGKNGCGKSTLLKMIAGVLLPSAGTIDVRGKVTALLELGTGFNPEFTGVENIHFYSQILGFGDRRIKESIDQIIDFADIGEFINQPVKVYSSGMKSRLGFSVAVHVDPDILILDEILAVGDAAFRRKCYRKMNEFFNQGKTVILVSHDENAIIQHCSRAILIDNHAIKMDGAPDDVISAYRQVSYGSQPNKTISGASNDQKPRPNPPPQPIGLDCTPTYTNQGVAEFTNVTLDDTSGTPTQLLEQGRRYSLSFNCLFKKSLEEVSIGAQLRTLDGFLITGANSRDYCNVIVDSVEPGQSIPTRWSFNNLLVPGTYTVYLYLISNDPGDTVIAEDVMMFRVNPVKRLTGGLVNLDQTIEVDISK